MEETRRLAANICGTDNTDEILNVLVQAVESCLDMRLRDGVSREDCGGVYPVAAALWAAGLYEESRSGGNVTGFSAGSVSLTLEGQSGKYAALAAQLLTPWLRDTGFSFKGV